IRTPLTAMGLLIGTAERTGDEAERIRALHELETLVSRVGWLVTALLKLAKADAGAIRVQARPVDAARLVRDALAPLAGAFDLRDVACETHVDEGVVQQRPPGQPGAQLILKNCMGARRRMRAPQASEDMGLPPVRRRHGPGHRHRDAPPVRRFTRRGIGFGIGLALAGRSYPGRHAARGRRPRNGRRSLPTCVPKVVV
ncbi:MAG: sensor histidine kinase, partial [Eggerthellaceae bacterium]